MPTYPHLRFTHHHQQQQFLASLGFTKNNFTWSSERGAWISFDEDTAEDWNWKNELEFLAHATKTAYHHGLDQGRKDIQSGICKLIGARDY